jgi:hypothetical protein
VALLHAGASLNVVAHDNGVRLQDDVCDGNLWPGGSPAQFLAHLEATDRALVRRFLLRARAWLDGGEGGAVLLRANMRLCYGCRRPRPKDGPGATTCPGGCGDPGRRAPAGDAWRQMFHEIWYCGDACVAEAGGRHAAVCAQTLRWAAAAAAAAVPPGTRVRLVGLVSKPELNGRTGVVQRPPKAEAASLRAGGRVKVALDDAAEGTKPVGLKYGNTELL